jgi:hypothetical protein
MLEIRIDLGAFIDGQSLLFAELWRTDKEGQLKDKPGEDKVRLCTGEGSGPKTVRVEWPIAWSHPDEGIEHVCARVRLGLNGDGSMCLPMPLGDTGAIVHEEMPAKEEVGAWPGAGKRSAPPCTCTGADGRSYRRRKEALHTWPAASASKRV